MIKRRALITLLGGAAALPFAARAQEPAPRIVFSPELGVAQDFRVGYRRGERPASPARAVESGFELRYRLTVTPVAREMGGYRLRLLMSEVEWPNSPWAGMNMVIAAAVMADGVPIEMLLDERGFLRQAADWPAVQQALADRLVTLPRHVAVVAFSVIDHNAQQVARHLAGAIDAIAFVRSYLDRAERVGASTISWYGSAVDIAVEPADADGAVAIAWAARSRTSAQPTDEGRAMFRRDGLVTRLTRISAPPGMSGVEGYTAREIMTIEAMAAR